MTNEREDSMRYKRILIFLSVIFLCIPAVAAAITWEEIIEGSYSDENTTLTVTRSGDVITIDGGNKRETIEDVQIDSRTPNSSFGSGTYVFKNVNLAGMFSVVSEENNKYTIILEKTVVDQTNSGISLDAGLYEVHKPSSGIPEVKLYRGEITVEIWCDIKKISAMAIFESKITLKNYGSSQHIDPRAYSQSIIIVDNNGSVDSFLTEAYDHSEASVSNRGDISELRVWAYENSNILFQHDSGEIGMLALGATDQSQVKFINDGEIANNQPSDGNEWGDFAIMIDIDGESHVELMGNGSIKPGIQMLDYYREIENYGPVPGASVVYDIQPFELKETDEENIAIIQQIAENVILEWKQFEKYEGADYVVAVRRDDGNRKGTYVVPIVRKTPVSTPTPTPTPTLAPTSTPSATITPIPVIDLPKTGDDSNLMAYVVLLLISAAAVVIVRVKNGFKGE